MSDLPNEITEKILLRFPARLLLRFTLVCKQWRSLISDPNFVRNHANHASLDQSNLHCKLITDWTTEDDDSSIHSVISQSIDYESLNSTNFEFNFETLITPAILGSCNGLLLLAIFDKSLEFDIPVVWNPLFSKIYRVLPLCISGSYHLRIRLHGFGYAPSIDDYKVVILNQNIFSDYDLTRYSELVVEVYSLKTSSWKIIPGVPSTNIVCKNDTFNAGTRVHESIYWFIWDSTCNSVVIAFDLVTEEFKLIDSPWGNDNVDPPDLVHVRGYLGAFRSDRNAGETVIWIWNEDENKKGFWTKLLRIPTESRMVLQILSFKNNGEVLLQLTGPQFTGPISEDLVIYDSESMMFRDIPGGNFRWPVHMVETLVSPVSG